MWWLSVLKAEVSKSQSPEAFGITMLPAKAASFSLWAEANKLQNTLYVLALILHIHLVKLPACRTGPPVHSATLPKPPLTTTKEANQSPPVQRRVNEVEGQGFCAKASKAADSSIAGLPHSLGDVVRLHNQQSGHCLVRLCEMKQGGVGEATSASPQWSMESPVELPPLWGRALTWPWPCSGTAGAPPDPEMGGVALCVCEQPYFTEGSLAPFGA